MTTRTRRTSSRRSIVLCQLCRGLTTAGRLGIIFLVAEMLSSQWPTSAWWVPYTDRPCKGGRWKPVGRACHRASGHEIAARPMARTFRPAEPLSSRCHDRRHRLTKSLVRLWTSQNRLQPASESLASSIRFEFGVDVISDVSCQNWEHSVSDRWSSRHRSRPSQHKRQNSHRPRPRSAALLYGGGQEAGHEHDKGKSPPNDITRNGWDHCLHPSRVNAASR